MNNTPIFLILGWLCAGLALIFHTWAWMIPALVLWDIDYIRSRSV